MMLQRRNFGSNLFDEMFNNPFFGGVDNGMMKTNLEEKGNKYVLDMELPGFDKKDIQIQLDNGYLTVSAEKSEKNDSKDDNGNYIFQERFNGQCSRSFYVGDSVKENDIKAAYNNGILELVFPKMDTPELQQQKYIPIE